MTQTATINLVVLASAGGSSLDPQLTLDDPKVFAKPVTISINAELAPDTEMLETVCNENEQDLKHFVVTEADRKRHETVTRLAPEILTKYAGTCQTESGALEDPSKSSPKEPNCSLKWLAEIRNCRSKLLRNHVLRLWWLN